MPVARGHASSQLTADYADGSIRFLVFCIAAVEYGFYQNTGAWLQTQPDAFVYLRACVWHICEERRILELECASVTDTILHI